MVAPQTILVYIYNISIVVCGTVATGNILYKDQYGPTVDTFYTQPCISALKGESE